MRQRDDDRERSAATTERDAGRDREGGRDGQRHEGDRLEQHSAEPDDPAPQPLGLCFRNNVSHRNLRVQKEPECSPEFTAVTWSMGRFVLGPVGACLPAQSQRTSAASSRSSSAAGSSVSPPCTGPGCTTVLRGALQEAEPGAAVLRATEPAASSARHTRVDELQAVADRVDVDVGVERAQPVAVDDLPARVEELRRLAVEDDADVDELLALDARDAAQHDVLVGLHAAALPGTQTRAIRRGRACRNETYAARTSSGVSAPGPRLEPLVGHGGRARPRAPSSSSCAASSASSAAARGACAPSTWSPTSYGWAAKRAGSVMPAAPRVVEVQRGAVVDQPQVAVPDQQVGVAPAAVDVGDERVQPQRPGGDVRPGPRWSGRSRRSRAGSRRRGSGPGWR